MRRHRISRSAAFDGDGIRPEAIDTQRDAIQQTKGHVPGADGGSLEVSLPNVASREDHSSALMILRRPHRQLSNPWDALQQSKGPLASFPIDKHFLPKPEQGIILKLHDFITHRSLFLQDLSRFAGSSNRSTGSYLPSKYYSQRMLIPCIPKRSVHRLFAWVFGYFSEKPRYCDGLAVMVSFGV